MSLCAVAYTSKSAMAAFPNGASVVKSKSPFCGIPRVKRFLCSNSLIYSVTLWSIVPFLIFFAVIIVFDPLKNRNHQKLIFDFGLTPVEYKFIGFPEVPIRKDEKVRWIN